jgi:hypothetical protein
VWFCKRRRFSWHAAHSVHTPRHGELDGGTVIPRPRCILPLDNRSGIEENILPCACMNTRIPLCENVGVLLCQWRAETLLMIKSVNSLGHLSTAKHAGNTCEPF